MKKLMIYLAFFICFGSVAFVDYFLINEMEVPSILKYTFIIGVVSVMFVSLKFDKKVLS